MKNLSLLTFLSTLVTVMPAVVADIPPRPEQLEFPPLQFEPPDPADFRHELSSGVVVFLAPDRQLPLINLSFTFKGGAYMDSPNQIGLADATGAMIRRGGSKGLTPQELDEEFDFLAANVATFAGSTQSAASLNTLSTNFERSFELFMEMLRDPRFDQDRLDLYKTEVIEALKQRNDDADPILSREWNALMYGRDHFEGAEPTQQSIESISRDDLIEMHRRIFHPAKGNLWIAVTGDFTEEEMLAKLESALSGWPAGEVPPDPPAPTAQLAPGVYHVEKDIPQGKVYIGMRGITHDHPDYFPVMLMNHILGGGGFTSRITARVRSDEGLAYSAGSSLLPRVHYPGEIRASFQSKNPTVALAIKIISEEIARIRSEDVTDDELQTAKNALIETFPRTFESKAAMLNIFVNDEMTSRPKDFWKKYRDNVRAVTKQDIQRVANMYLAADKLAIMIVGKWAEIEAGDLGQRASMRDFFAGKVTHLPLRDPLTLEPIQ